MILNQGKLKLTSNAEYGNGTGNSFIENKPKITHKNLIFYPIQLSL